MLKSSANNYNCSAVFERPFFKLKELLFVCSLLKSNGSLLAFAGSGDKEARVTAAIASSIWNAYHSNIKQSFHTESLNFVLMDCDVCSFLITEDIGYFFKLEVTFI